MPPPRAVLALVLLALAGLALLWPRAAAASRQRWRWPVRGDVVGAFRFSARHPFAGAQRRGIDIAAPRGSVVRAACGGRVSFVGSVPGGGGLGVSVRCGRLVATHLGLARLAVRRGERVLPGTRLGALGRRGLLRLGARLRTDRFGYVDPLDLLDADPPPAAPRPAPLPLGRPPRVPVAVERRPLPGAPAAPRPAPLPLGRAPRVPVAPANLARRPLPRPVAVVRAAPSVPRGAWAGLVVLAAGVPLGGLVRRSRRRRAHHGATVAVSER